MARGNFVLLYGYVRKVAITRDEETGEYATGRLHVETVPRYIATYERRAAKSQIEADVIPIFSASPSFVRNYMKDIKEGDMVIVKGQLATYDITRKFICPDCKHTNYDSGAVIVIVIPDFIKVTDSGLSHDEGIEYLGKVREISNVIKIFGTVCREIDPENFKYDDDKFKVARLSFQIASIRKHRIIEDGKDKTTDFPWVKCYGPKAVEYYDVLQKGSTIEIEGAIQTRKIKFKSVCENCGAELEYKGIAVEIVPSSIEYIKNCKTPARGIEIDGYDTEESDSYYDE